MASFSEWSNNKKNQTGGTAQTGAQSFSAWSNQKLGKEEPVMPQTYRNQNTAFERSGLTRDEFDSSVRENYAQQVAQQNRRTTSGGFYSQPTFGEDTERLQTNATTAQRKLESKQKELENAAAVVAEAERGMGFVESHMNQLYSSYQSNPTQHAADLFNKAYGMYETRLGEYNTAVDSFNSLYAEYEPLLSEYNTAAGAYNDYITGQQKAYSDWKGTIRSAEDIRTDMAAQDSRIEELQQQQKDLRAQASQLTSQASSRRGNTQQRTEYARQAAALRQQADGLDDDIAALEEMKTLLAEELEWADYFRYADLTENEDFAELSKYVSTETGEEPVFNAWSGMYTDTGFADVNYDIINRNETAKSRQGVTNISTNASLLGLDNSERGEMTDEEIAIFNYLYAQDTARGDAEHTTAYAYIDYLTSDLNYRKRQADEAQWAAYAAESPVGSSIFSILESPLKGLSYIGQLADYAEDGEIDQNAGYNKFSYLNSAIRNEVSGIVEENWGGVGTFAYQTGMSMGDFLFNTAISGGNQAVALAIMGSGAAADGTIRAKDRGLTDDQAFALGTIAGAAEIITEKLSLDALLDATKLGKSAFGYFIQNTVVEGTEEVGADFINLFADIMIAKDKSEWQQSIDAYIAQGCDKDTAFWNAFTDQAIEMGLDFLGGAISGATFAGAAIGGNQVVTALDNRRQQRQQTAEQMQQRAAELQPQEEMEGIVLPTAEEAMGEQRAQQPIQQEAVQQTPAQQTEQTTVQMQEPGMLPTAEQAELNTQRQRTMEMETTELERSGIEAGAATETIRQARRISQAIGRDIVFYNEAATTSGIRNGYYSPADGKIHVNSQSQNPLAQIISHELTHSVELAESYGELRDIVLRRIQQTTDLQQLRQQKMELYARNGVELQSEAEIDQEIVAEYVERYLLTDERSIMELTRENRTLGERILRWINDLLAKLGNAGAQERAFLTQARDAYAKALNQTSFTEQTAAATPQTNAEAQNQGDTEAALRALREAYANGEITEEEFDAALDVIMEEEGMADQTMLEKNSFGGVNANGANLETLRQAQEMERQGVAAETIFKETGWYTGADGKWRFEMDDSSMEYRRTGDAKYMQEPEYKEYMELWDKAYRDGDANDAELERLRELDARYGRIGQLSAINLANGNATLGDILVHDELFRNYPQLRKTKVEFADLGRDINGQYNAETDTITLSSELRAAPEGTLIHEIQHAVQRAEGFAKGANTKFWERQLASGYDGKTGQQRREVQRLWKEYNGIRDSEPDFFAAMVGLEAMAPDVPRGAINWDTMEQIEEDPVEWQRYDAAREKLEAQYGDMKVWDFIDLRHNLKQAEMNAGRSATELYYDTAGEVEARDAAKRRTMTAEQRREIMPNIGDEDTVFTETAEDEWDGRSYSITDIQGENGDYGQGVLLDTNIFDGISPRNWGKVLGDYVYKNMAGAELTMYDDAGNPETVFLASETDRVRKDGAKNSHKAIDKLARYRGDNIRALATVHLPEALATSGSETSTDEHSHQWMDEKGWVYRTAYLQDRNGNIYEATLNIADGRDRRILYDITNIRKIDTKKEATGGVASSTDNGRDSHTSGNFEDSVTDNGIHVKRQFSVSEPVETTDRLIAWHNMSVESLESALELGGLAMPSFAVKPSDIGHDSYGECSIIARKESIDPQESKDQKIYGGDAWTPVFPDISYKPSAETVERVRDTVDDLVGGADIRRQISRMGFDADNIRDALTRNAGNITRAFGDDKALRYAYLQATGKAGSLPMREENIGRNSGHDGEIIRRIADEFGLGRLRDIRMNGSTLYREESGVADRMLEIVNEYYETAFGEAGLFTEMTFSDFDRITSDAYRYAKEGAKRAVDTKALQEMLNERVDEEGYEAWLKELFDGIVEKKGIRNDKDMFTPSGNRRSWEALHVDYTLANIVKEMRKQAQQGRSQFLSGANSVKGAALKAYGDIEAVRADTGRLRHTQEDAEAAYEEFTNKCTEICSRMLESTTSQYVGMFEMSEALAETLAKTKTRDGIKRYMEREFGAYYNIYDGIADDVYELYQIANRLPMEYFESKLYRAYPLDEAAAIVVPDDTKTELISALQNAGATVETYEAGNEEDRLRVVNNVEGAKFSISERQDKQEIVQNLRGILNRGGNAAELRRYVDTLDSERADLPAYEETEAAELVRTAHNEGLSVDEYLRQNWESYEYDGELNETARQALELEKRQGRRRYSISDNERVFTTPRGVEVVQNPTDSEYRQMREEAYREYPWLRGTGEPMLRHTYDEAGNEYYWRADLAMHAQVEPYINEHFETRTSQQWQWWTREDKDDYPTDYSRRYSIDEETEDITSTLPVKARQYLRRTERYLLDKVSALLSVPRYAQREFLQDIVRDISTEYLQTGTVSQQTIDDLFERAYDEGIEVDSEYYDTYKHIKEHLRTQAITLSERDKTNITDWGDFRKSTFGTLRIVNDGGLPVDVAYMELQSMAPELFPEDIIHPADQLMRMFEVGRSIQRVEKSLDEVHGYDAEEFKRWAKNDFDAAVNDVLGELRQVKRFADERAQQAETESTLTQEQVAAMYGQLKDARRTYEKAAAKNLLTQHDEIQVGRLLRGEIELEHLDPAKDNIKGITAVYEAKQEYERLTRSIREWNQSRKAKLRETADGLLETANDWKDKKAGILYSRETMERNIRDIVKDSALAERIIAEYFKPVHDAQAEATRMKNKYRERVLALNLSRKVAKGNTVSEAHAVQLLGEAEDCIRMLEQSKGKMQMRDGKTLSDWRGIVSALWSENPKLDKAKIETAVKEFRSIYDELFQQMNESRVRNGYEPVNYRSGYFPHFQPGDNDGILGQFGKALGIDMDVSALPTTINGLTHTFKPGIQWFGNAQERLGFNTAYDAVEGFDRYIEGVADVVHQTDNIQKLRALATQTRYRTGDEGIRKQVDAVMADTTLSETDKQNRIEKIYETGRYALSNFVVELEEYTNLLANKKSRADRNMEQALGRRMYELVKKLESRVAANMVAINPASWLTNFIPLTQGNALLDRGMLLHGMWDTLKAYKTDDGIVAKSTFLTNRRGSDPIVKTWAQAASAKMSSPMEHIDQFTADSLVRARYRQNIKKGLSEDAAMSEADSWVAGVMADRSKGSTPTLFNRSNPVTKVFTQFQLEVNNQLGYLFKDMPRDAREKGLKALAAALLKFFLGAYLYNEVYEYVIGRRPALDPLGILNDTVGDITGYELPNLVELGVGAVTGDMPSFEVEKKNAYGTAEGLATAVAEELPFVGGILGGGRVPISSALPDWASLGKAFLNDDWSAEKRLATGLKELGNPATYLALPFGGGQIKKIYQGIKAVIEGGSYSVDSDGNDILQYPVYRDGAGQTILSTAGAVLFGKSSLPTGRDWVESGFKSLGAKETACYQAMMDAGIGGEEAFDLLQELRGAEKNDTESESTVERGILRDSDITGEGKSIVYYGLMASDKERELMDALADDADMGEVTSVLMEIKDAGNLAGAAASNAKREAIMGAALTDDEKKLVYRYTMGTKQEDGSYTSSRDDDIVAFEQAGMDFDQFLQAQNEYSAINEEYDSAGDKAMEFSRWVNSQMLTVEQADTMRDCFKYYSQIPQEAARYNDFVTAGLDDDAAYELANTLNGLEPLEGEDTVSSLQRYRAVVDAGLTEDEQMTVLSGLMTESEYGKLQTGYSFGVTPAAYVAYKELLPQYDADGNGSFKQEEVEAAIDALGTGGGGIMLPSAGAPSAGNITLTNAERAALWQMANKSWKPKNNPYDTYVGQQVYDALNAEPATGGLQLPSQSGEEGGIQLPSAGGSLKLPSQG